MLCAGHASEFNFKRISWAHHFFICGGVYTHEMDELAQHARGRGCWRHSAHDWLGCRHGRCAARRVDFGRDFICLAAAALLRAGVDASRGLSTRRISNAFSDSRLGTFGGANKFIERVDIGSAWINGHIAWTCWYDQRVRFGLGRPWVLVLRVCFSAARGQRVGAHNVFRFAAVFANCAWNHGDGSRIDRD